MKINKKILIPVIMVICIAWAYNLVVFIVSQTDGPLFFRQQTNISEDGMIEFRSVENIQKDDPIVTVRFPEINDEELQWLSSTDIGSNNISYKIMNMFLGDEIIKEKLGINNLLKSSNIVITKMIYTTQSGKEKEVNLGKIIIDKKFVYDKKYKMLVNLGGESSNRNSGTNYYYSKDNFKIIAIEGENLETINKFFDVYVNEVKLEDLELPMVIERNQNIIIDYKLKDGLAEQGFDSDFEQYNMQLKLKCSDPEGTVDYMITNINANIIDINDEINYKFIKTIKNRLEEN